MKLTHLDENGAAHMVNIGAKPVTQREAVAQSVLTMQPETLRMILDGTVPKGDVFACARIAGIMAAKRTAELIPMCHPIPIESVTSPLRLSRRRRCALSARCVVRTRPALRWKHLRQPLLLR